MVDSDIYYEIDEYEEDGDVYERNEDIMNVNSNVIADCEIIENNNSKIIKRKNHKKRSHVWDYYKGIPNDTNPVKVKCEVKGCGIVLAYHKSTTTLIGHLRSAHNISDNLLR